MEYSRLYIWVEGRDDSRFIKRIFKPQFNEVYDFVSIIEYAKESKKWIKKFLHSIEAMEAEYIFLTDNDSPCITADKHKFLCKHKKIREENLFIVVKEIESWYLAGLDDEGCSDLGVEPVECTDEITKEDFDRCIPKSFSSRTNFMLEILKRFIVDIAKEKNSSMKYFLNSVYK